MKTKKKTNPTGKRKKNPEKANWNKSKAESDKPGRDGPARQPSCGRLYLYIPLIPARGERERAAGSQLRSINSLPLSCMDVWMSPLTNL